MNQHKYNKLLRPVIRANDTLAVFFALGLLQLMDVVRLFNLRRRGINYSLEAEAD